jgi:hypothetical protein
MATIELYGREVIPRVRELLSEPAEELASANGRSAGVQ